jgi:predicted kinase
VNRLLIVVAGPPCSGKSTHADALSRRLAVAALSMDKVRQRILPKAAHTRADRQAAYRAMHFAAELLLRHDASIILDAPYGHQEDRDELERIAAATHTQMRLIECRVSAETAVRRFHKRGPDPQRPDLTENNVAATAKNYVYANSGLTLEMDALTPEQALQPACDYIET